jgi:hypothetical protein
MTPTATVPPDTVDLALAEVLEDDGMKPYVESVVEDVNDALLLVDIGEVDGDNGGLPVDIADEDTEDVELSVDVAEEDADGVERDDDDVERDDDDVERDDDDVERDDDEVEDDGNGPACADRGTITGYA